MKNAKGKLLIIGGKEDKGDYQNLTEAELERKNIFTSEGVLKRLLSELKTITPRVEVITTASQIPEEVGEMYAEAFKKLNVPDVGIMHIKEYEQANNPEFLERLKKAHAILLSGGDQNRLVAIYARSKALRILQERYRDEPDFLIAGTSAGAMCMSKVMITGSFEGEPGVKGTVQTGTGLGLLDRVIIDTHFIVRPRLSRLLEAVAAFPDLIGVGLGEDTAILITANQVIETVGSGLVVICDGRQLTRNNFAEIINGDRLSLHHVIMHFLPKGESFEIAENKIY